MVKDTIAAISTGMTNSGIGKVRMSGNAAIAIADQIYRSPGGKKRLTDAASHTIHYGYIYDGDTLIDEVLVLIMKGPHSLSLIHIYSKFHVIGCQFNNTTCCINQNTF